MSTFNITRGDQTLKVSGERMPTEEEIRQMFDEVSGQGADVGVQTDEGSGLLVAPPAPEKRVLTERDVPFGHTLADIESGKVQPLAIPRREISVRPFLLPKQLTGDFIRKEVRKMLDEVPEDDILEFSKMSDEEKEFFAGAAANVVEFLPGGEVTQTIISGLLQQPVETVIGFGEFFVDNAEMVKVILTSPKSPNFDPIKRQEAIDQLRRDPLYPIAAALMLTGGVSRIGKKLKKQGAQQFLENVEKGKIKVPKPEEVFEPINKQIGLFEEKVVSQKELPKKDVIEVRVDVPPEPTTGVRNTVPGGEIEARQQRHRETTEALKDRALSKEEVKDLKVERQLLEEDIRFANENKKALEAGDFRFEDVGIEQRFQAAKGVEKEPFSQRVKAKLTSFKNKATREFEHLPKTGEFSQLRFDLLKLRKQKGISGDKAIRSIDKLTRDLDTKEYDLFTRKVILEDLVEISKEIDVKTGQPKKLPFGFEGETATAELGRLNKIIETNPKVMESVVNRAAIWDNLKSDYIQALGDIGFDVSKRLTKENYFRHIILDHANARATVGGGKKLKTPSNRGYLKERRGSELDINTEYIQAEYEVMAQMMHDIEVAKVIKSVDVNHNISAKVKADAKAQGISPSEAIPEGFVEWQPREGNIFYMTDTIPHKLAEGLLTDKIAELGISKADLGKALAIGRKRKEFIVPEEVAKTLDNLVKDRSQNIINEVLRKTTKAWKIWTLTSPRRLFKYNLRNVTGDSDAAFIGNPSGFKKVPQAASELLEVYKKQDGKITPELQHWLDRGGMQTTLQVQELGDLNNFKKFARLNRGKKNIIDIPADVWKKYFETAQGATDFREAVLRYANHLEYLEQIEKSGGTPKNFGASIPEEIMALADNRDKAFMLSNDLLGAYDKVSVLGQSLREHIAPFWSWKEVNFGRYVQFAKNLSETGEIPTAIGKKLGAKTPYLAYRSGAFLVKATAFAAMLETWNRTKFPELEEQLTESERMTPHIILGTDKDGNIITFNRMGALGDFLEWFGLETAPHHIADYLSGKKSAMEVAKAIGDVEEIAKAPLRVATNVVSPFLKTPGEIITRRGLFPDVFKPRLIRDRGLHLARSLGLANEYKAITDLPSRPFRESVSGFFVYKTDPFQAAYTNNQQTLAKFKKRVGKGSEGFWLSPKSSVLYNLKSSIRYSDAKAGMKYLDEYIMLGGTPEGLEQSLEALNPLHGLNQIEKNAFVASLDEQQTKTLLNAITYWEKVLLGGVQSDEDLNKYTKELNK